MLNLLLNILVIFTLISNLSDVITSAQETNFSTRQLGQSIGQCFSGNALFNCLENKIFEALDQAIANTETWKINDFLVVEKYTKKGGALTTNNIIIDEQNITKEQAQQLPLIDKLALKLLQIAQTRSLKIQLPSSAVNKLFSKRNIYSSLEDLSLNVNDPDAKSSGTIGQELEQEEGRKKKHKDKNLAMMGGMAMLAMVAQMFLSKIMLIAGAGFVVAKVALLISVLGSLKKAAVGSLAGIDHVIVAGGGGVSGTHSH